MLRTAATSNTPAVLNNNKLRGGIEMRISIDKMLYMDCPEGFRQLSKAYKQKHEAVLLCLA